MDTIINKVAESGLITLDLEDFYPKDEILGFDLKDYLFMGMILKEKDFRAALQNLNWENFRDKMVAVYCSADAIIPLWAYMLVSTNLSGIASKVFSGTPEEMRKQVFIEKIRGINSGEYKDQRVIIKGCGDLDIGDYAYVEITNKLTPVVKSLMYGEACSTVPVYKKKSQ
ncbi:MAG TPA: DUF2480 family protein [Chitinophagaceae bacterium]|nr:DUF2480 family protein [Chitinophagaceae bacterium]